MTPNELSALIERFNAARNNHALNAAVMLCTEDALFESTGPSPTAPGTAAETPARETWGPIFSNPASHFNIEEVVALGGARAAQRFIYSRGDGHIRGIDLFTFRDGLVSEKLSYVKD